jgi:hypothetical protein
MLGTGMIGCAVVYLVPLILLIVILVKIDGIAKTQERSLPRSYRNGAFHCRAERFCLFLENTVNLVSPKC